MDINFIIILNWNEILDNELSNDDLKEDYKKIILFKKNGDSNIAISTKINIWIKNKIDSQSFYLIAKSEKNNFQDEHF